MFIHSLCMKFSLCVLEMVGLLHQADKQMFSQATVSDLFILRKVLN